MCYTWFDLETQLVYEPHVKWLNNAVDYHVYTYRSKAAVHFIMMYISAFKFEN